MTALLIVVAVLIVCGCAHLGWAMCCAARRGEGDGR